MGVLGLTPFLQKACPDVIKELPTRLRALAGKTIAIDGNLVTQRLHFGAVPHPARHIIGWHRIVTDLRAHNIRILTVWDGPLRSAAKAREVARRQAVRVLSSARGTHEEQRLRRLQRLMGAVKRFRKLEGEERVKVARAVRLAAGKGAEMRLREMADAMGRGAWGWEGMGEEEGEVWRAWLADDAREEDVLRVAEEGEVEVLGEAEGEVPSDWAPEDFEVWEGAPGWVPYDEDEPVEAVVEAAVEVEAVVSDEARVLPPDEPLDAPPLSPTLAPDVPTPTPVISLPPSSTPSASIASELSTLYLDFQSHLLTDTPTSPSPPSKFQSQLTAAESSFWTRLSSPSVPSSSDELEVDTDGKHEQEQVETLLARSGHMASSYERRNRLPTPATYVECRRLLAAMGVPTLIAPYPYEAEALAASLVLNGKADLVASEDTDVLVYEAPLLRGLTSRHTPLALIEGTAVREALHLDKAAWVDFALLLGTDFTTRVKNLGPHTAIKLIRTHGSIEAILLSQSRFSPPFPQTYLEQVGAAREVFASLPPLPPEEDLEGGEGEEGEVRRVLREYGVRERDLGLVDEERAGEGEGEGAGFGSWKAEGGLGVGYFGDDPAVDRERERERQVM